MANNKLDLLGFQQNLNSQFLEIFESKKLGKKTSDFDASSILGLLDEINGLNFFLPLTQLKNISMNNVYEEVKLANSWVCGFNQVRGDIYTILDFNKVIEYIKNSNTDVNIRKLNAENRIVYLKEYNESKIGLIINSLLLEYSAEYTHIFAYKKEDEFYWELNSEVNFSNFVKSENMSIEEYELMNKFNNFVLDKKRFDDKVFDVDVKNSKDWLLYLISDIYLDTMGKRPIFTLNIENLTKVLLNVSPF